MQGGVLWGGLVPAVEAQTPRPLNTSRLQATPLEKPKSTPQSHLKWRPSARVEAKKPVAQVQQAAHVHLLPADGAPLAQNTSQGAPSDPFNDPFGDQIPHFTAQQAQPPAQEPPSRFSQPQPMPEEELAPPMAPPVTPPSVPPMEPPAAPLEPQPGLQRQPAREPLPPRFGIDPEAPNVNNPDCETIYNGRNCCDEADNCRIIRTELARFEISNINLDISAPFSPDEADAIEAKALQDQRLGEAPSRPWRNIQGELVTEGRLVDIQGQKVSIDNGSEIVRIGFRELGSDEQCFLAAYWNLPYECGWTDQPFQSRNWAPLEVNWTASALCHKPLYFEERALERYGHMSGPISQPLLSGAHFFASAALLPYQMGLYPPTECRYALGYYRPGNCAPYLIPPIPLSARAAAAQAGAVIGAVYWIP